MSIAPIGLPSGFGIAPGFGLSPAYGVAGNLAKTPLDAPASVQGVQSFGNLLAQKLSDLNGMQKQARRYRRYRRLRQWRCAKQS